MVIATVQLSSGITSLIITFRSHLWEFYTSRSDFSNAQGDECDEIKIQMVFMWSY